MAERTNPLIDFSAYMAERTQNFTGRTWVFQAINNWLGKADGPRFFLLTGEPGSGKSAIASRLVQFSQREVTPPDGLSHLAPSFLNAFHFCSRRDLRWTNPQVFSGSLALQLAARFPAFAKALAEKSGERQIIMEVEQKVEKVAAGAQVVGIMIRKLDVRRLSAEDAFIRVLREPLEALLGQEKDTQVLILVDSLNEALETSDKVSIVSLLSRSEHLPRGVRFILTSRPVTEILRQLRDFHLEECSLASLEGLRHSSKDVEDHVMRILGEYPVLAKNLAPEISPDEFTGVVRDRSEGNFLYVKYLLDMLLAPDRKEITRKSLEQLPNGLDGIYLEFLERFRKAWKKYGPVLGTMAVSQVALSAGHLAGFVKKDELEVRRILQELRQFLAMDESLPASERLYTIYHRSLADFLLDKDRSEEFWCQEAKQHDRIVRYYLDNFQAIWLDCDSYGLLHLVAHMKACLDLEQKVKDRKRQTNDLFSVVLDQGFRQAQLDKLGDPLSTLADLRTTLDLALAGDDLVMILACAGAYRDTIRSGGVATAVFTAVDAGDFERGLRRAELYGAVPDWPCVLHLYLAWEAAEQGDIEAAQKAAASGMLLPHDRSSEMTEALLVRTARTLGSKGVDTRGWLAQIAKDCDPDELLAGYKLSKPLDGAERLEVIDKLKSMLSTMESNLKVGSASAEGRGYYEPGMDDEAEVHEAIILADLLTKIAADNSVEYYIDLALEVVLPNPYPRYRDIGLLALGRTMLSIPNLDLVRPRLRRLLETALDREGVTFTFDLAAVLHGQAQAHNLPATELWDDYLEKASNSNDFWGTMMRAYSAFDAASSQISWDSADMLIRFRIYSGYATLHLLSLANRCIEFGCQKLMWQPIRDLPMSRRTPLLHRLFGLRSRKNADEPSLIDAARNKAGMVNDPTFREERLRLVEAYITWLNQTPPDAASVPARLATLPDQDTRMAYIDYLSARFAWPLKNPNWEGLKMLVPLVLTDATTLDAILGRIFRLRVHLLNDQEISEAIRICKEQLITGRPWEFGQWRGYG